MQLRRSASCAQLDVSRARMPSAAFKEVARPGWLCQPTAPDQAKAAAGSAELGV